MKWESMMTGPSIRQPAGFSRRCQNHSAGKALQAYADARLEVNRPTTSLGGHCACRAAFGAEYHRRRVQGVVDVETGPREGVGISRPAGSVLVGHNAAGARWWAESTAFGPQREAGTHSEQRCDAGEDDLKACLMEQARGR